MTPRFLVESALIAEGVILVLSLIMLFGHAWLAQRRERRWAVPVEKGRRALLEVVRTGRLTRPDEAVLRGLPVRQQIRLFTELVPSITGQSRDQLAQLAREIGLIPVAERMAASRDWRDRLHGVRLLSAVGGGDAIVPPLLEDPHPAVRTEAVEWVGTHPTPDLIERLVKLLPRTDRYGTFVVRDSLLRVGPDAIAPLARYLERHNGRHAEPALDVAAGMPDVRFAGPAMRLCGDPLPYVRARAAALAGAVGSEEAVGRLQALVQDEDAEVRAAAAAALGRLGHWPSASVIAPLLRDRAWIVRSQSALALRRLGSPGILYLRKGLGDSDPFAADISRQVLDLPESSANRERWT
ncbi:HEAT repeat domain-containing protein [Longimicrobium sp.]|uniref:HEAT repeat domain-containing protein n=1 Tax=Longimicrobium sp. TaxID=2029185 RepID=UPI002E350C9C|nr:HEAT repeat domain-containing protein [Longimicrobium sp.]HEX6039650.1 HEAT repeat domain-containing protein [Longimicrobium sp.]